MADRTSCQFLNNHWNGTPVSYPPVTDYPPAQYQGTVPISSQSIGDVYSGDSHPQTSDGGYSSYYPTNFSYNYPGPPSASYHVFPSIPGPTSDDGAALYAQRHAHHSQTQLTAINTFLLCCIPPAPVAVLYIPSQLVRWANTREVALLSARGLDTSVGELNVLPALITAPPQIPLTTASTTSSQRPGVPLCPIPCDLCTLSSNGQHGLQGYEETHPA